MKKSAKPKKRSEKKSQAPLSKEQWCQLLPSKKLRKLEKDLNENSVCTLVQLFQDDSVDSSIVRKAIKLFKRSQKQHLQQLLVRCGFTILSIPFLKALKFFKYSNAIDDDLAREVLNYLISALVHCQSDVNITRAILDTMSDFVRGIQSQHDADSLMELVGAAMNALKEQVCSEVLQLYAEVIDELHVNNNGTFNVQWLDNLTRWYPIYAQNTKALGHFVSCVLFAAEHGSLPPIGTLVTDQIMDIIVNMVKHSKEQAQHVCNLMLFFVDSNINVDSYLNDMIEVLYNYAIQESPKKTSTKDAKATGEDAANNDDIDDYDYDSGDDSDIVSRASVISGEIEGTDIMTFLAALIETRPAYVVRIAPLFEKSVQRLGSILEFTVVCELLGVMSTNMENKNLGNEILLKFLKKECNYGDDEAVFSGILRIMRAPGVQIDPKVFEQYIAFTVDYLQKSDNILSSSLKYDIL